MKLVVGLGNPGEEYVGTRHNVGFEVVDRVASRCGVACSRDKRLGAVLGRGRVGAQDVMFCRPLSYMNRSGPVVARLVREREVALEDLLIVTDDYNLELATLRLRTKGSAGGHNGLRSLIAALGTEEFPRLRIGVGEPPPGLAVDFVLTRFKPAEREPMDGALDRAATCVEDWCTQGVDVAMTRHNG